jgi:hypothetical protein
MIERAVILVEGYDDRAFWSGFLRQVCQCAPVMAPRPSGGAAGVYRYESPSGARVEVIPVQEQRVDAAKLQALLNERLRGRATRPDERLRGVVICQDDDQQTAQAPRHDLRWLEQRVGAAFGPGWTPTRAQVSPPAVWLNDGPVVLAVDWWLDGAVDPALPAQQTLERVVCAALARTSPAQAESARAWLAARPAPAGAPHKAAAAALWAGWRADDGWARFYEALWEDPAVRAELLALLPALRDPELRALLG